MIFERKCLDSSLHILDRLGKAKFKVSLLLCLISCKLKLIWFKFVSDNQKIVICFYLFKL